MLGNPVNVGSDGSIVTGESCVDALDGNADLASEVEACAKAIVVGGKEDRIRNVDVFIEEDDSGKRGVTCASKDDGVGGALD